MRMRFADWIAICLVISSLGLIGAARAEELVKAPGSLSYVFLVVPATDPTEHQVADLIAAATIRLPGFKVVRTMAGGDPKATLLIERVRPGSKFYSLPSRDTLDYVARGLTDVQKNEIDGKHDLIALFFGYENTGSYLPYKEALTFTHEAAAGLSGFIYDESSRQIFTQESWKSDRIDTWEDANPNYPSHFAIHTYQNGEYYRAGILGLPKFGLPELTINDLKPADSNAGGNLVNLVATMLAQGRRPDVNGKLAVAMDDIVNNAQRGYMNSLAFENAKRRSTVQLEFTSAQEGDANAEHPAIVFPAADIDRYQAQTAVFDEVFGWKDDLYKVSHEDELLAASERAKKRIAELSNTFTDEISAGHTLLMKGPFPTDSGGTEWMWIAVTGWKDGIVTGVPANKPYEINDLLEGAIVSFREADAFDYLLRRVDVTEEGNETSAIIQRLSAGKSE